VHGIVRGDAPQLDLARERALQALIADLAGDGLLRSAHDCSDGGAAVTLAESCFDTNGIGCRVELPASGGSVNAALFSESASRIVVSADRAQEAEILKRSAAAGVPARRIGVTGGGSIQIAVDGATAIDVTVDEAERVWSTALEHFFKRVAA
jgi:phosphoribosylformylglycinamidine synthase